jgi:uncharacterized protein
MQVSKYTFLFKGNTDEYYVYNTLSNALAGIDKNTYQTLENKKENLSETDFDKDTYEMLANKRFICENEQDEFLVYKAVINSMRSADEFMHLTIAPTMNCNFRCHYCFEAHKPQTCISEDGMDALIKNIETHKNLQSITLTWFGGEPLMALPQMKRFYDKFMAVWGDKKFSSNIITTAYFIDKQAIQTLKDIRVTDMQITLDGLKENHNKVKFTDDCADVFSKIIENVDLIYQEYPEMHITFRVNLTKQNISDYIPLYKFLTERYKGKNVGVAPAFVMDRTNKKADKELFFDKRESAATILSLMWKHKIHSPQIRYPSKYIYECAMRNKNAISIDAEGYVYKCWEIIGNKKYAIGKLNENGEIVDMDYINYNRQMYGADPLEDKTCSKCSYLPICSGGCPIQRVQNEFEGWHNNCCTIMKGYLPQFLLTHLALKKAGFENK